MCVSCAGGEKLHCVSLLCLSAMLMRLGSVGVGKASSSSSSSEEEQVLVLNQIELQKPILTSSKRTCSIPVLLKHPCFFNPPDEKYSGSHVAIRVNG